MFRKRWYALFSIATIVLGYGYWNSLLGWGCNGVSYHNTLTLMSYNIGALHYQLQDSEAPGELLETLFKDQANAPGILCLQETGLRKMHDTIARRLDYAHHFVYPRYHLALFSKYPVENIQLADYEVAKTRYLRFDVNWNDRRFRVINVHMQSNLISTDTERLSEHDLREGETWRGYRSVLARYFHAAQIRERQVAALRREIERSPYPVVLCGDLNTVPMSYVYRQLTEAGMTDHFREAGCGYGASYAKNLPGLKIDYIFSNGGIQAAEHQVMRHIKHTDHYPVWSRIYWKETELEEALEVEE